MTFRSRLLARFQSPRNRDLDTTPIFILAVPRSGSTLLRTLLDSHPSIACGPETPWLGAHQPSSVMSLHQFLTESPFGYCRSFGVTPDVVTDACRQFVTSLLERYARAKGKQRWAEKTPDNLMYLEFLVKLFPDAAFIHLVRDGLDTAISTAVINSHRRGISEWHEKFLLLGPQFSVENNLFNALLRWNHWNARVGEVMKGYRLHKLRYEDLVSNPAKALHSLFDFLREPFESDVLDYGRFKHELPEWEWGSADVKHFSGITKERVDRRRDISDEEREILQSFSLHDRTEAYPAQPSHVEPGASAQPLGSRSEFLVRWINSFAMSIGTDPLDSQRSWAYSWLWFSGLQSIDWRNKRVIVIDAAGSPLPWILAFLGASVVVVDDCPSKIRPQGTLKERLKLRLEWILASFDTLPFVSGWADAVIACTIGRSMDAGRGQSAELLRILTHHAIICLAFPVDAKGNWECFQDFLEASTGRYTWRTGMADESIDSLVGRVGAAVAFGAMNNSL